MPDLLTVGPDEIIKVWRDSATHTFKGEPCVGAPFEKLFVQFYGCRTVEISIHKSAVRSGVPTCVPGLNMLRDELTRIIDEYTGGPQPEKEPPRMSSEAPRPHVINGEFQSDKYKGCPPGKVPLSVKDPTAQALLWQYAQLRRSVDAAFADDLEYCLRRAGYLPTETDKTCNDLVSFTDGELATAAADKFRDHLGTCLACREKLRFTLQLDARLSCLDERRLSRREESRDRRSWDAVIPVLGVGALLTMIAASLDAPAMSCAAIPLAVFLGVRFTIHWKDLRATKRKDARGKP